MDERHWWIATKIQETFNIDGAESPTALERFLVDPNHLGIVSQFFSGNGWNKLYIYGCRPESGVWQLEDLKMVTSLINVPGGRANGFFCVYFLRRSTEHEIEVHDLQHDIFCGEIKSNPLHQLSTALSQIFLPALKAQSKWEKCPDTQGQHFVHNVEKCVNVFTSAMNENEASKQQILRLPKTLVMNDFKQHRISSQYDSVVVHEYELAVQDWIQAIDGMLSEGSNERLMDMHSGPLIEVEKWHRRQRILASIMEQLKTKECKNVIGVLIQSKSRLVKKWKATDLFLTDVQNETKDKVKYLDALEKHLQQLQFESNPCVAVNSILPAIISSIRQLESISRFYARSGFLGLLCKKICNRLVSLCREYVLEIVKPSYQDNLWRIIQNEINEPEPASPIFKIMKRGVRHKELVYNDNGSLVGRLKACLSLHTFYRDTLHSLKETLLGTGGGAYSLPQSQSSLEAFSARGKKNLGSWSAGARTKGLLGSVTGPSSIISESDGKDYRGFSGGISMADEDSILEPWDALCRRMKQLLDIIASLRQFSALAKDTAGLPRPRAEDIPTVEEDERISNDQDISQDLVAETFAAGPFRKELESTNMIFHTKKQTGLPAYSRIQKSMETLQEEEEDDNEKEYLTSAVNMISDEANRTRMLNVTPRLDQDVPLELPAALIEPSSRYKAGSVLKNLCSMEVSHGRDEPWICMLISDHIRMIIRSMEAGITTSLLLDIQGRLNDKFEESYTLFLTLCQNLDQLVAVYLAAMFAKPMKTQHGLKVLSKFKAVSERTGLSNIIADHYNDVYTTFGAELYQIQKMYDDNKVNPIVPRNAPPAAGAIYWSKQLFSHIEEPMNIFHTNKALNQNKEYHRAVRFYNLLAKALVTCETVWYKQWIKSVENAPSGLRAPLLAHDVVTGNLLVNVDQKFLNLIHETRWMLRMKLDVPNSAKAYLACESQFKKYRMHLEQNLCDFKQTCSSIPSPLVGLFRTHTDEVLRCLQGGLSTITWDSMNIDAYLHKISSATTRLKSILTKVQVIINEKIEKVLSDLMSTILFDQSIFVGERWTSRSLLETMQESIQSRTLMMKKLAQNIKSGVCEIIDILTASRVNSADHCSVGRKQGVFGHRAAYATSSSSVIDHANHQSGVTNRWDQELAKDILRHYAERMYLCVKEAICNTLCLLHTGIGEHPFPDVSYPRMEILASSSSGFASTEDSVPETASYSMICEDVSLKEDNFEKLRIEVEIMLQIPNILFDPPLSQIQQDFDEVVESIISASKEVLWWANDGDNPAFDHRIRSDETVSVYQRNFSQFTKSLRDHVNSYVTHLSKFDFLWKDDMHHAYVDFMFKNPTISSIRKEVEYLLAVEKDISSTPENLQVGCLVLRPRPIIDALRGLAAAWKTQYSLILHEDAKKKLDTVVQYRNNVQNRLSAQVVTLDQLNSTLGLIEEIHDMENKIDDVYLPIENMYNKLKEYDLRLACSELQQVDSLRECWWELMNLADRLGHTLLKEHRDSFEQELGKQLKTFVVEVIQFRNAFDAQGPAIPGVHPADAVIRLQEFQNRFTLYDAKRKTLDSVQQLFGIVPKPFPELDKTGEELKLLGMLYGLFQKFIAFDRRFRESLWENVDLHLATTEVESYWEECLNLPKKLKDWDAYTEMTQSIKKYLDVLPLLHRLAKKGKFKDIMIPEIRNRHWLQVMSVTFSKFQLESNVLKLGHLLDVELLEHREEIQQICNSAHKELDLEVKMRVIEEEWTEQVLSFESYKNRGPIILIKDDSERLLEQLEDSQALLASMLTSKHIGPLREEAASWAEKLKGVSEVLDTWLETQNLWQQLEAVFSNHVTAKDLPQEAKRFWMVDKSYVKLVKRAYDTRNILQCCFGGEVPKDVVLRHMQEELEICFKSLTQYLNMKRSMFPRFNFLTDSILLAVLSRPNNLESVRPHLRSIFSSIADIKCEKSSSWSDTASSIKSLHNTPTPTSSPLLQQNTGIRHTGYGEDYNMSGVRFKSGIKSSDSRLIFAGNSEDPVDVLHAAAVMASDGEILHLDEEIGLYEGAELWLRNLSDSVSRTIHASISKALKDVERNLQYEEIVLKYPAQIGRLILLYIWTRECEAGISELKWERRALQNASKKFNAIVSKLPGLMNRTKGPNEQMTTLHRSRMANLIYYSVGLRDSLDALSSRKIRDLADFEWRRSIRFYSREKDGLREHDIHILDSQIPYGMEFYGTSASSSLVVSPGTERAFVSMSLALAHCQGSCVVGNSGDGKTETVLGMAHLLGKYIYLVSCTNSTDPSVLAKSVQGIAADDCWVCFDNIHLLPVETLSVLLEFSYKTMSLLANLVQLKPSVEKNGFDADPSVLDPKSAIFVTYDPKNTSHKPLITAIRSLYRSVSITKPDITAILKAKCTALGLRSPKTLADRLQTVFELAHLQLPRPASQHHEISIVSLVSSLTLAAQKRKSKDEQSDGISRSDTVTGSRGELDQKMSRSNSQSSVRMPISSSPAQPGINRSQPAMVEKIVSRKFVMSNALTTQAKNDHGLVVQAIIETISPGLSPSDATVFHLILRDAFCGIPLAKEALDSVLSNEIQNPIGAGVSSVNSSNREKNLEMALRQVACEKGLVPSSAWLKKATQLFQIADSGQGIILCGPTGCGKSSILSVLVDALCTLPLNRVPGRAVSPGVSSQKLQKIYPLTVDDLSLMFGKVTPSREWMDGILTNAWRKANRNQSTMWLCLDGALISVWADRFASALSNQRVLQLGNGDHLYLTRNMRLVFETSDLKTASPSLLSNTGLVHVDKNVLGWRPLAKAWLELRTADENRVLQTAFDKTLDSVCSFVFNSRIKFPICETGLVSTCLTLLAEMLNEHQQHIGGDLHIERLYLFCLIWAFGGLLEGNAVKLFSDVLRGLSSALPDYDHDISVFDYYVDESGEWDTWAARVPEATYTGTTDLLGEVYVDTIDTIRTRSLLDFAHMARRHTLLIGEPGIGKTSLLNDFLDTQDKQMSVLRHLVFSNASTASQLHGFVHNNIQHRQGYVYGAKDGKFLELFIDDLNLPQSDAYGVQRCNELLRSLVDDQTICKLVKPFEWRSIEGLEVLSTVSANPSHPSDLSPRLLRHFAIICLRGTTESDNRNVIFSVLEANMSDKPLSQEMHDSIAYASAEMLQSMKALKPSPLPGRQHYAFCLRQIVKMCRCLRRLDEENRSSDAYMISFWKHEMQRLFGDQLCHSSDIAWFDRTMESIIKKCLSHFEENKKGDDIPQTYFSTFPIELKTHHGSIVMSNKETRVRVYQLNHLRDVYEYVQSHMALDFLTHPMLSDDVLLHIIRIHRVLSYQYGGNMTIVGAVGSQLSKLTELALRVAKMQQFKMDASRPATFFDSLRSAVRIAGIEGKPIAVVLTARELYEPLFLDAINSILISGEYPHLFSDDEIEGLLQVLIPILRHAFPNMVSDPMKFFLSRVKSNLHIVLNLPPMHKLLADALQHYPGIMSETQILWIRDWPQDVLIQQAEFFINHENVAKSTSPKNRECLTMAIANIHSLTLRDCKQALWGGDTNATVSVTGTSLQTKKDKETIKVEKFDMPNLPYSKLILLEQIKLLHRDFDCKAANEIYVGPYTYRKFMHCLHTLFLHENKRLNKETKRLQLALETLEETRDDAKMMQKAIAVLRSQYQAVETEVNELFMKLTTEATRLEKLKAHHGMSNGPLSAYLQLQQAGEECEEDLVLLVEQHDEYDDRFNQICEANLKSKLVQIEEDIVEARKELDSAKTSLVFAKGQVETWRSKVDRGCIERLKAFQNPPALVAQVLEMVMVLVGAHPYIVSNRGDVAASQASAKTSESRTPKTGRKLHDEAESRVSSSSTMKMVQGNPKLLLNRQKTRRKSNFGASGKSEGPSASVDRNKWKSMQNFMNDTARFVEMIHSIDWENGLQHSVLTEVESYLKKGSEGQEGVTGEGSLLDHATGGTTIHAQQRKPDSTGITISSARYSSEDAAVLVEYVISIVEYTRLCGPLKKASDTLHSLELEMEVLKRAEKDDQPSHSKHQETSESVDDFGKSELLTEPSIAGLTRENVEGVLQTMKDLQKRYDHMVIRKHHLQNELKTSKDRLHSALATLTSLKSLEKTWKKELGNAVTVDQLLTNCVLAAAFHTYCGGMTIDARRRMTAYYTHVCNHYDLPIPDKMIFNSHSYADFILNPIEVQSMRIKKLALDDQALDNACLLSASECNLSWCLVCDPSSKVVDWINDYYSLLPHPGMQNIHAASEERHPAELVQVLYRDLRSHLETCLSEGHILLITYCDLELLVSDRRFHDVLRCRYAFLNGKKTFKIMVGDHEVECNPNFRLFLHTSILPQYVPPELAAYTTVIYYQTARDGVQTELLDRFVRLEKNRLQDEWSAVQVDKMSNLLSLSEIQDELKDILVSKCRLLNDLNMTRQLRDIKKSYDEAMEMKMKLMNAGQVVERAKESFTHIATRGAVLYEVVTSLFIINSLYCTSWQRFLSLYDANIRRSEHLSLKAVCSQMTHSIFSAISKGLLREDRLLFALMLSLEVEDSLGNVNLGEREYLISPSYGAATMVAIGYHPSEARSQTKKVFDWMTDEQFQNVLLLGMHYEWFFESFDRMPREGREMQWRALCEVEAPEQISGNRLPDNSDSHYTPLQKLLIIRAIRSDRVVQASTEFIASVLGRKFLKDESHDISTAMQQSSPCTPIMLLFGQDDNMAADYMIKYIKSANAPVYVIECVENMAAQEVAVVAKLATAMKQGGWIFLQNAHFNKEILMRVFTVILQHTTISNTASSVQQSDTGNIHDNFRLFMSCPAEADEIPFPILHDSVKHFVDHPKPIRENLLRSFSALIDPEVISWSSRPEWLPSLHNVCMLHGVIRLRAQFPINVGWQDPHSFNSVNTEDLKSAIDALREEFGDVTSGTLSEASAAVGSRPLSWSGIRYRIAELIYGDHATNPTDQMSLNALVDYWLAAGSVKKDFELPKVRYRLPSVFFGTNAKQSNILQALEGIAYHSLDCPEGCNLHSSSDAVIGNDQYIFTRLNKLYDSQPESKTVTHKLYPQPPGTLCGPHFTAISSSSNHPWVVARGVFASHSHTLLRSHKEIELWEVCYNALSKIPKGWSKDYINDRIRKIGGQSPFGLFLQKELEQLHILLGEIKRSLTNIKAIVENLDHVGDNTVPEDVITADALYHSRIPPRWMVLAGETAPPDTTSLSVWLGDITLRASHFEKILLQGKDKVAAYWLGAFFNPHGLMAIFKQEALKCHLEKYGNVDNVLLKTEITQRDKDHLRDPPAEGIFLHGVYLWGSAWEKTTSEMQDAPARHDTTALPVIHVSYVTEASKIGVANEASRPVDYYSCPVFVSTTCVRKPVFHLDIIRESIPSSRWALRGLTATIRPY